MQVVFKISVVRLDDGRTQAARDSNAGIVSKKRRLDMHHVDILRAQPRGVAHELAPIEGPIFRITRHLPRGDPNDLGVIGDVRGLRILRSDQRASVSETQQILPKSLNRRRHPVDSGEVDVRDHEDSHRPKIRSTYYNLISLTRLASHPDMSL